MKKFYRIFAGIIFVAVFIALFLFISETLRLKTGGSMDMVHSFYELEENSVDVLGLGSSHAYYALQPNQLWEEYGITAYTLASPQQSLPMSYFLLKEALNYQKPKVLLLESYYFCSSKLFNSEARLRMAFDGMRNSEVKKEMLDTLLPDLSWKDKLSWYMPLLKYHSRWQQLTSADFHTRPYYRGGKLDTTVYPCRDMGLDIPERAIPEVCLEYFEKIVDICEENNIELIVYATPYNTSQKAYEKRQGTSLALEKYLVEREIPFLFLQRSGAAGIDFETDFRDPAHLNLNGQRKVTGYLGKYLDENYELPNHKGDPEYAAYEEDYLLFQRDLESGFNTEYDWEE